VRTITCWTLARYSKWLVPHTEQPATPAMQAQFDALLDGLLKRVLDRHAPQRRSAAAPWGVRSCRSALTPPGARTAAQEQAGAGCRVQRAGRAGGGRRAGAGAAA
jgi:hypothetical protein